MAQLLSTDEASVGLKNNQFISAKIQQYEKSHHNGFFYIMLIILLLPIMMVIAILIFHHVWIKHAADLSITDTNATLLPNAPSTALPTASPKTTCLHSVNYTHIANPTGFTYKSYDYITGYIESNGTWIQPTFKLNTKQLNTHNEQNRELESNECKYIFIGDSITYHLRGEHLEDVDDHKVFNKYFNDGFVYAMSAITIRDVGWRLNENNGMGFIEMKKCLNNSSVTNHLRKIILLIGTNDIGYGLPLKYVINDYAFLTKQIVSFMSEWENLKLYLIAIFPRAEIFPAPKNYKWLQWNSFNKYFEIITCMNENIKSLAKQYDRVEYIDCNQVFFDQTTDGTGNISINVLWDLLHPTPYGYQLYLQCLLNKQNFK